MRVLLLATGVCAAAALGTLRPATGPLSGRMPADFSLPPGRDGIILFDGVCNFCNRWVGFVVDNDVDGAYAFASMQSEVGRRLLDLGVVSARRRASRR